MIQARPSPRQPVGTTVLLTGEMMSVELGKCANPLPSLFYQSLQMGLLNFIAPLPLFHDQLAVGVPVQMGYPVLACQFKPSNQRAIFRFVIRGSPNRFGKFRKEVALRIGQHNANPSRTWIAHRCAIGIEGTPTRFASEAQGRLLSLALLLLKWCSAHEGQITARPAISPALSLR